MKISIILITYNHERYILDALQGILSQTIPPDEVIIADDCSTDSTQAIILDFVNKNSLHDKWKLIFNESNVGITKNARNALDNATSDIIVGMAGDDISLPNRCLHAIDLFKNNPDIDMIAGSILKIDEYNNIIGELTYPNKIYNEVVPVIKNGTPNVFPVGVSYRKRIFDTFGPLPTDVPNEDDQLMFWGILDKGVLCSSEIVAKYRINPNSASSWLRNKQSNQEFYSRFISDMPVRKRHMELWKIALKKVQREDTDKLNKLLDKKIELYALLSDIEKYSFFYRVRFAMTHLSVIGLREFYYVVCGKFGILSWRWLKKMLRKI